ncbi:hypothetical protein [Commensalibacter papalotli (ex Botero et al. 2024)]|uniref:Uncharacterized protein n=1 Tax=Commensalibacter papalotli (ex Botero et al. 2024) TaxID=2972766 RepID=A0ABN8WH84_9PROT|nr:hypothetical protein [Commensalibacter papalotli (ex Botero et al. 2024)]CAI3957450.1 unnamed protein product [Commensalibacter papalotli (ex Botero et al. 2024)]CAI3957675.1 unnamed protein product [Commensalibacter papalotli (ex Botero et al. 2024)]
MSDIRVGDSNNTYTTCYNQNHTTNTYVYDYSLTIYHPKSICNDINQCIDSKNYKQNAIFSSHISYKIEKAESSNLTYDQIYAKIDDKIYQKMTDAIFATFPLNQNSLVYF